MYEYCSSNDYESKNQTKYEYNNNNKIPINVQINNNPSSIRISPDKNINLEESLRKNIVETSHHERKSSAETSSSFESKTHSHSHSESYSYYKNNDLNSVSHNVSPILNDRQINSNRYNDYLRTNSLDRSSNNHNTYETDKYPKNLSDIMAEMISHDKSIRSNHNHGYHSSGSYNNLKNIVDEARRSNQRLNETNNEITFHLKNIVSDIVANNKPTSTNGNSNNSFYNHDLDGRRNSSNANSYSHSNSVSSEISSKENYNYNYNDEVKPKLHDIVVDAYDKNKPSHNINTNSTMHNMPNNSNGLATVHSSFSHSSSHTSSSQTTITEHIIRPGNGSYQNLAINNTPSMKNNSFNNNNNNHTNNFPINNNNSKPTNFNEFTNLNPKSKSPYLNSIIADILGKNSKSTSNFVNTNGFKPIISRPLEINANEVNKIVGDDRGLGIIRLTVHYDELRTRLSITVHEARYLI